MPLTLDALQVVDAIHRRGSFAAAADELHRVPSAITYQVRRLEEELDVLVFDRRGHRARLTEAGQELVTEGRRLLAAAAELEQRVRQVATGWEAELRIAVDAVVSPDLMTPLLAEFYRNCEPLGVATRVRLLHEALAGTWDAIADGRADLALGAGGDPPGGLGIRSRHLGTLEHVFAVAPGHPLASAAEPLPRAAIAEHRAIAVADTARGLPPRTTGLVDGQLTLTVADMRTKLGLQIAGLGCGYLPRYLAAPEVARGRLVVRRVEEAKPPQTVHVAWRREHPGRALKWWIDTLAQGRWTAALAA